MVGRVDPRMRGGAIDLGMSDGQRQGRSPHARGSLRVVIGSASEAGSIPACAGEPKLPFAALVTATVDPRMRGGATTLAAGLYAHWGRSPHARGSQKLPKFSANGFGSIPACAGEPLRWTTWRCSRRVDPRMRGGAQSSTASTGWNRGRSPHARGSRSLRQRRCAGGGSIPACAGEPRPLTVTLPIAKVDPRMRGGAKLILPSRDLTYGRSPHARGSRKRTSSCSPIWGSIPACAGEPCRGSKG